MLRPLFARVLLQRDKLEKVGSILIPSEQQKRYAKTRGKVIAIGPTVDESIQVGMTVLVGQHAGGWVNADGDPASDTAKEEFFIVQDEDILCVIEDEKDARAA